MCVSARVRECVCVLSLPLSFFSCSYLLVSLPIPHISPTPESTQWHKTKSKYAFCQKPGLNQVDCRISIVKEKQRSSFLYLMNH